MKEDRFRNLKNIIPQKEFGISTDQITGIANGAYKDEPIQYVRMEIEKGSDEAKKLEENGYVLIYPKMPEEGNSKNGMDIDEYVSNNSAMIVDKVTENPNIDLAYEINKYYHSLESYNKDILAMSMKLDDNTLQFGADTEVREIYDKIGIKYEQAEDGIKNDIIVHSDVKKTPIEKGKMAQIYDKVKGKVKGAFNNLKNFFKGKENKNILGEGQQEFDEK